MMNPKAYALAFAVGFAVTLGAALPPAPRASEMIPAATSRIEISVNQGQLVRLSKPVNSVFIADPAIADVQVKSPTLVYVIGKAAGSTSLYAVSEQDEVILNTQVRVNFDASRVEQAIHELVPRSTIAVNAVADSLVLSGTVYSTADGDDIRRIAARFVKDPKQLVNKMEVDAPNQINLRVRVAAVSRDIIKQFGINMQNAFNNGHIAFGLVTAGQALISGAALSGTGKVVPFPPGGNLQSPTINFNTQDPSLLGGAVNNNLYAGATTKNYSVNSLIDALDNHGLITVLAEPNLTAANSPCPFRPAPVSSASIGRSSA
jgi:pilus assembly protein CpaC